MSRCRWRCRWDAAEIWCGLGYPVAVQRGNHTAHRIHRHTQYERPNALAHAPCSAQGSGLRLARAPRLASAVDIWQHYHGPCQDGQLHNVPSQLSLVTVDCWPRRVGSSAPVHRSRRLVRHRVPLPTTAQGSEANSKTGCADPASTAHSPVPGPLTGARAELDPAAPAGARRNSDEAARRSTRR